MSHLTHLLEQMDVIRKSQLTPEEKELLMKVAKREIPATDELEALYLKAAKQIRFSDYFDHSKN